MKSKNLFNKNSKKKSKNSKSNKKSKKCKGGANLNDIERKVVNNYYPQNKIRLFDSHGDLTGKKYFLPDNYCLITCVMPGKINYFNENIHLLTFLKEVDFDVYKIFNIEDNNLSKNKGKIYGKESYTNETIIGLSKINRKIKYLIFGRKGTLYELKLFIGPIYVNESNLQFFEEDTSNNYKKMGGVYYLYDKGHVKKKKKPFNNFDNNFIYSIDDFVKNYNPSTLFFLNCRELDDSILKNNPFKEETEKAIISSLLLNEGYENIFDKEISTICNESGCTNIIDKKCKFCNYSLCEEHIKNTNDFYKSKRDFTELEMETKIHYEHCNKTCSFIYEDNDEYHYNTKCKKTGFVRDKGSNDVAFLCYEHYIKKYKITNDIEAIKNLHPILKSNYELIDLLVKESDKIVTFSKCNYTLNFPFIDNIEHINKAQVLLNIIILNYENLKNKENYVIKIFIIVATLKELLEIQNKDNYGNNLIRNKNEISKLLTLENEIINMI